MTGDKYWRYLNTGDVLFREGDAADHAYVIEAGYLEISKGQGDQRTVLATLGAGEVVGEMAVVDQLPRTATAVACGPARLLVISREHLESKLGATDPLVRLLLQVILKRYRQVVHAQPSESTLPEPDHRAALAGIHLARELEQALERGEFELYFQPVVNLRKLSIEGYEALIRWNSPTRGVVLPGEFIPVLEESGLIQGVGRWVLQAACLSLNRFNAQNQARNHQPVHMSVNLSGRQLAAPNLMDDILGAIKSAGIPPPLLRLEVTESFLVDNMETAAKVIDQCREIGAGVSVDDFGTGYSSLNYLSRFAVDTVKIDRSFIAPMLEDKNSSKILHAIRDLARALELKIIAEGVENMEQARWTLGLGIEDAQGYLFSRPLKETEARNLMVARWPWQFERREMTRRSRERRV